VFGVQRSVISRDNPFDEKRRNMLAFNYLTLQKELMMPACATPKTINAVRHTTRELICNRQIARIIGEDLDDFRKQTIDSSDRLYRQH